jgi:hypothetical protein
MSLLEARDMNRKAEEGPRRKGNEAALDIFATVILFVIEKRQILLLKTILSEKKKSDSKWPTLDSLWSILGSQHCGL